MRNNPPLQNLSFYLAEADNKKIREIAAQFGKEVESITPKWQSYNSITYIEVYVRAAGETCSSAILFANYSREYPYLTVRVGNIGGG